MQRAILDAIAEPAAAVQARHGEGPVGTAITAVWLRLCGTAVPTAAQRQSVRHAIASAWGAS